MRKLVVVSIAVLLASCEAERAPRGGNPAGNGGDGGTVPTGNGPIAQLEQGNIEAAFTGFVSGSTPRDAFGACLTRTLKILTGPAVNATLARFGAAPIAMADLAGPRSVLSRNVAAWSGQGQVVVSPSGGTIVFGRARARPSMIIGSNYQTGERLQIWLGEDAVAGTRMAMTYDCTNGHISSTSPSVYLTRTGDYCSVIYQQAPGASCAEDGGALELVSISDVPGDTITVRADNLLLGCDCIDTTCAEVVRISGELSAPLTPRIDTAGLSPLVADLAAETFAVRNYVSRLSPGTTADALLRELLPVTAELDAAAADCERAGQGSGVVFTIPGELFAGEDLPVTAADATIFAGLLEGAAALVRGLASYEHPLELASWCTPTECISEETSVERLNAARPRIGQSATLQAARTDLSAALELLVRGIDGAGADGMFPKNAATTPSLGHLRGWFASASGSLSGGGTLLPSISPPVRIDLQRLFTAPPDFQAPSTAPFIYDFGVKLDAAFLTQTLDPVLDLDWDSPSGHAGPDGSGEALEAFGDVLSRHGMIVDP